MAAEKKYYWLKLSEDFFHDKAIKKLRKLAGGDTYTIIYLKMLLKSMKDNGFLYYDGIEETFPDEVALDIDEDPDNVKVTMEFLIRAGLLTKRMRTRQYLNNFLEWSDPRQAQRRQSAGRGPERQRDFSPMDIVRTMSRQCRRVSKNVHQR